MPKMNLLYDETQIRERIKRLAAEIMQDYSDEKPIVCVCVLRGAVLFFSDLIKELKGDKIMLDFVWVSSYQNRVSSGQVKMLSGLRDPVRDKHVLIVEDIVDTGYTLSFLYDYFADLDALDVKSVCLLNKPMTRKVDIKPDHVAFTLQSSAFVVGYGLDQDEIYRNYNGIYEVVE